jgi:hypothetical protein
MTTTGRHPKGSILGEEVLIDTGGWKPRVKGLEGWPNHATDEVEVVEVVIVVGCRPFSIAGRTRMEGGGIVGGQGLVVLGDGWLSGVRSQRGWFLVVIYDIVGNRGSSGPL